MLPPYILLDVDIYGSNPRQLLESHAPATASDGTSALYFLSVVRAKTAGDYRERRSVPGGFWRSDRAPVPLVSEAIQGTRRTFFYTELGSHSHGEKIGTGFMMQELILVGEEEARQGGDGLALCKIYVSPHGGRDAPGIANSINKRKIGEQGVASSSKRRKMVAGAASFSPAPVRAASAPAPALRPAPALPVRSSSLPQQDPSPAPALRSAPALPVRSSSLPQQDPSPAPALPVRSSSLPQQDPSPAPPLRSAPALPVRSSSPQQGPSPAPPLRSAPALPVRSSSPQQGPSPAPPLRSAPALPVRSSSPQQGPSPAPPLRSAPALPVRSSSPQQGPSPAPPLRSAPALPVRSSSPQQGPSPAPPLRSAPALPVRSSSPQQGPSPAPPLRSAPALPVRSSSPQQDPSPAPPVGQGACISSAPLRQAASTSSAPAASTSPNEARRLLVLEICKSPLMERGNILKHIIYGAAEILGGTKRTLDCTNLVLFEKKKMLGTESFQDISSPALDTHHLSFTFQEINAATLGFRRDHFLGEGRSAKVYKGVLLDGNNVAIKVLNPNGLHGNKEFCTGAMALSRIYHPNLLKLGGFCTDDNQRILIYEYMPLGSLEKHIFDLSPHKKALDWNTRINILAGAAEGLKHLHVNCNPAEIHGDVKSGNILLGEGCHPKLSNFGLAKLGPPGDNTHVPTRVMGTSGYCAPEYLESGELTIKSDVFSFGVVIMEVITGRNALGWSLTRAEPTLAEWATPLTRRNDFTKYADPALGNKYNKKSLLQVLSVARMCLNPAASLRPDMADVAAALTNISMSAGTDV
ncbi:proline-rich receptor-like protein kinase PERK3 [Triticum aestivum]|uniref:proline-rich receptor-like protein kinase PERK3 n=1 Tax=Triticum aestivum TaxID=4565 RepID=UPI001D030C5A|nr:proline-rich receptor-like protein kinase PERK3 [Triticum aestivum]